MFISVLPGALKNHIPKLPALYTAWVLKDNSTEMESISLVKADQKDLSRRVKAVKKDIKSGKLKIKNEPVKKKNFFKSKFTKKLYPAIYVGHIPHGFYEKEMKSYFSQFGKVIRAAVARSKKTGRSKGYGFVEFENCDVAEIAADTMNNYLMFNKILKCSYIPPESRRSNLKETPENQYLLRRINRNKNKKKRNFAVNNLSQETYRKVVEQKIEKFKKFFEDKGINFNLKLEDLSSSTDNVQKSKSTKSKTSKSDAAENIEEDEFGVLEVDESDSDIYFKTPPQVRKVFKKSLNSSVSSEKKLLENKKSKSKIVKAKIMKENSTKTVKPKKSANKKKTSDPRLLPVKVTQKSTEKKEKMQKKGIARKLEENKPKKKSLAKSFKTKKNEKVKSLQKGVAAMLKEEKVKGISNAMSKLTGKAKVSVKKMKKK